MSKNNTKYQFFQEASLSQKLADKIPIYQQLAGSDPELSIAIGTFQILGDNEIIDLNEPSMKLIMELLNVQRQAKFATSDKVNEITKMGLQMPKAEDIISSFDKKEE